MSSLPTTARHCPRHLIQGFSPLLGPPTSKCLVEFHPFYHRGPPSTGQGVTAVSTVLVGAEDGALCPICQWVAVHGDHHGGCGGNSDRILWHDSIRDALFSAAQSAASAPRKEAPSLIPGSSSFLLTSTSQIG